MSYRDKYDEKLLKIMDKVDKKIQPRLAEIDEQIIENQAKVLSAFQKNSVAESHLSGSTGYGHYDEGRDVLEQVYADTLGAEAALVRPQFVSGTHAIGVALLGLVRPGDEILYITGEPYDTLQEVLGLAGDGIGSPTEYGIRVNCVDLKENGEADFAAIEKSLATKPKVVAIQRSRGYATRESFTIAKIKEMIEHVRAVHPDAWIFVDNAYGEFSETVEPVQVGADLMAGSLYKNAGSGIVSTGAYIVGRADLVERVSYRFTVPGLGAAEGATSNFLSSMFQGFFMSPQTTGNAIKGAIFEAALLEELGLSVSPKWDAPRTDIVQTVNFGQKESMIKFAEEIQHNSPVDSYVTPIPEKMAGYEDQVIMAGGTFVQGSTIEFSGDGPIRPPYTVYLQGGLTYAHVKLAIMGAAQNTFFQK